MHTNNLEVHGFVYGFCYLAQSLRLSDISLMHHADLKKKVLTSLQTCPNYNV